MIHSRIEGVPDNVSTFDRSETTEAKKTNPLKMFIFVKKFTIIWFFFHYFPL